MTVSYPLTFPTHTGTESITIRQSNTVAVNRSRFTQARQTLVHPGQWWEADVHIPPMVRSDAAQWIGFLSSLKGLEGNFLMGDPDAATPLGSAGGTPLVNGASQTGEQLVLDGATAGQTGWLKAGDYIQLGSGSSTELYMVLTDANSDGSGNVTLDIWPDLRTSPADNAAIVTSAAKGIFTLASNVMSYDINHASHYGIRFSAVELVTS